MIQVNYTTVRLYDDFILLIFLHTHREVSVLTNELPEESDQFRFLQAVCFANLRSSVGKPHLCYILELSVTMFPLDIVLL